MKISTKITYVCVIALLLGNNLFAQNYFTAKNPAAIGQFSKIQVAENPNGGYKPATFLVGSSTSSAQIQVKLAESSFFDTININSTIQPFDACAIAGTASGPATLNVNQLGTFTEAGGTNGAYQWKTATVSGGPYTAISSATSNPASFSFAAPGTYYVVLARKVGGCADAISNQLTVVVSQIADKPCSAIPLAMGSNGLFSNVGATTDAGEPTAPSGNCAGQKSWCDATISHTIWGKFTAPASGLVSIAANGFDTKIAVYSVGNCGNYATYNLLAANDDAPGFGNSLINSVCVTPGAVYYVQLDGSVASDIGNNATIIITALDNAAPIFSGIPDDIFAIADCGSTTSTATWAAPIATDTDNCMPLIVTNNFNSGANFPIGTTTVNYTASDGINTTTVTFNVTVTAVTYLVTASASSNGSISPNASTAVPCGTNKTFAIAPATGYKVQNVLVDGIPVGAVLTYTFSNVTAAHTISVSFTLTPLPVTLTNFTATLQNKKDALLKWQTATETNTKGFEIEMAKGSATAFADISFIAGKGNTSSITNYSFIVPNLAPGTYYFRLRIIDLDGTFTYSAVQTVTIVGDKVLISVYPVPVRNQLTVILSADVQNTQLQLVNSLGQVLLVNTTLSGNIRMLNTTNLPIGLYLLKVMDGNNVIATQKVVKE